MVKLSGQNVLPAEEYMQLDLDELVSTANSWEPGVPFHLRNLVEDADWLAWKSYWHERNRSKYLRLGKNFCNHPALNAIYKGKDPNPRDRSAVYMIPLP